MHPVEALTRLGGTADTSTLLRMTTRKRLLRARREGLVLHPTRGRYVTTSARDGIRAAAALAGTASHASAAAEHRWELGFPPDRPAVIVPVLSNTIAVVRPSASSAPPFLIRIW